MWSNAATAPNSRKGELLPIDYHHVVFTIPEQLNDLVLRNKRQLYKILFAASAATLQTIAADPRHLGAHIGFFSILHGWGQNLLFHPHIHCVATGGGISLDGTRWVSSKPGFFLPVRVLSRLFRRLFLEALEDAFRKNLFKWTTGDGKCSYVPFSIGFRGIALRYVGRLPWLEIEVGGFLEIESHRSFRNLHTAEQFRSAA
jgi:hypothetical protein